LKGTGAPACLAGIIPEEDHRNTPNTIGSSDSSIEV